MRTKEIAFSREFQPELVELLRRLCEEHAVDFKRACQKLLSLMLQLSRQIKAKELEISAAKIKILLAKQFGKALSYFVSRHTSGSQAL